MRSARRSGIAVLLADRVMVNNHHPVSEPVSRKPSLTRMGGNVYTGINNLFPLSLDGRAFLPLPAGRQG